MSVSILAHPRTWATGLVAAVALAGAAAVTTDKPARGAGESIDVTLTAVEQGDYAWFDLSGFVPGTSVTVFLGVDGQPTSPTVSATFEIGSDGSAENADGQTYERLPISRTAVVDPDYHLAVYTEDLSTEIAESAEFAVTAATTQVTNPGDHSGGAEDVAVQRGGSWTFNAKKLAPNGYLSAAAVIGDVEYPLAGPGQASGTDLRWTLNSLGDTTPPTRVTIPTVLDNGAGPVSVPTGALTVRFRDTAGTVIDRTLTVEAPVVATASVTATATVGGDVTLTGEGWFNPASTTQGSRIAIKIDEGAYARIPGANPHQNLTIWAIVEADVDGTFSATIRLPDGTTSGANGSTPAFGVGEHSLWLLSGSLYEGDTSRTVKTNAFTVS